MTYTRIHNTCLPSPQMCLPT